MAGHLELTFDLGALDAAAAEEASFGAGALAVTLVDAEDDPVLEPKPGEVRLWPRTRVRSLFAHEPDAAATVGRLASALNIPPARIDWVFVPDRAWEREWLKDFHAMCFGRRLWVCPFHEQVTDPAAVVVNLDPGLAFGTGTHASTALCLEWLDANLRPGASVIDYGCGSGVLALAAAKLGAGAVHAFDIDPQALIATTGNAARNNVGERICVHAAADTLPARTDVLLANILSGALCELAPRFAALTGPGGQVVLAGIMESQAAEVTAAYASCFDVARFGGRDGWACLAGRRHG
ncbi:MAG: 50S ribosomal protein L11 methyltransferase [Proteobacteria bacterium]|nr:50S ribosomal protein L11 methyltransferase [Pseudomonadota bacterium]